MEIAGKLQHAPIRSRHRTHPYKEPRPADKLEEISHRRQSAHARFVKLGSKVYEAFLQMEHAAFSDGALPGKVKELVAVGISVVKNCESCMQWHVEQAVAKGATFDEVFEAIEVGIEMGGGPATVSARLALEVLDSLALTG